MSGRVLMIAGRGGDAEEERAAEKEVVMLMAVDVPSQMTVVSADTRDTHSRTALVTRKFCSPASSHPSPIRSMIVSSSA
jgi:hypothetical protein